MSRIVTIGKEAESFTIRDQLKGELEWLIKTIQVNSVIAKTQKNRPETVADRAPASSVRLRTLILEQ